MSSKSTYYVNTKVFTFKVLLKVSKTFSFFLFSNIYTPKSCNQSKKLMRTKNTRLIDSCYYSVFYLLTLAGYEFNNVRSGWRAGQTRLQNFIMESLSLAFLLLLFCKKRSCLVMVTDKR